MIRNVKDVSAVLDRRFGSAGRGPLSLIRILAWFVVGMIVAGSLVVAPKLDLSQTHYNHYLETRTQSVRDPLLDMSDPRGYGYEKPNKNDFRIAWVGTSTMQNPGGRTGFVPVDVQQRLPKIDGKPTHIDMYLLEAGRMMDIYSAVKQAIATKPDLIMVDLNPLWLFNDKQLQQWDNLNGPDFPEMITSPTNWRLLAAFDQPSDVALGTLGSKASILYNRWSYNAQLQKWLAKITPLTEPGATSSGNGGGGGEAGNTGSGGGGGTPTGLAKVATMQSPLDFWTYYRPYVPAGSTMEQSQEALLTSEQTDGSAVSDAIVGKTIKALAKSRIPSSVYLPALDPQTLKAPGVNAALRRIEKRLRHIGNSNKAGNVLVRSQSAIRYVHGLKFHDMVHMATDGPMVGYLARMVCDRVHDSNADAQCVPKG